MTSRKITSRLMTRKEILLESIGAYSLSACEILEIIRQKVPLQTNYKLAQLLPEA